MTAQSLNDLPENKGFMKKPKEDPRCPYSARLLQEFGILESEEAMQDVSGHAGFIKK